MFDEFCACDGGETENHDNKPERNAPTDVKNIHSVFLPPFIIVYKFLKGLCNSAKNETDWKFPRQLILA